jgi:hypothetical protein
MTTNRDAMVIPVEWLEVRHRREWSASRDTARKLAILKRYGIQGKSAKKPPVSLHRLRDAQFLFVFFGYS